MRRFFAVFALCLLGTAYAGTDVPFEARIDTFAVASDCTPACVNLDVTGVGQAGQSGRVTIDGPSQVSFITGAQTGESTMTAADGSTLLFEFEGFFVPSGQNATFFGSWTAVSGTGRFKGVSGGGTYEGTATLGNPAGDPGTLHIEGRLNNPGKR